jgi:type IX secretion system PorP/SprF family membrane protein
MRRLLSLVALTIQITIALAQQDPQFSLNMFNHLSTNPGYAGSNDALCISSIDRIQWIGFSGAPSTFLLNGDYSLSKLNSGIGLGITSDNIGSQNNFQFLANYAYRVQAGKGKLGIGMGVGLLNTSIHGNWITGEVLTNPNNNPYWDPSIPHDANHVSFDMSFGLFYRTNNFYMGLSSTHLNQAKNNIQPDILPQWIRHYYFSGGYYYQLPNPLFEIRPSLFIKSDSKVFQYDLNLTLHYNKRVWGGLSYRVGDAIVAMAGFTMPNGFKLAVAYDYTLSDITKYTSGSFELMLGWCVGVGKGKKKTGYGSVRFL